MPKQATHKQDTTTAHNTTTQHVNISKRQARNNSKGQHDNNAHVTLGKQHTGHNNYVTQESNTHMSTYAKQSNQGTTTKEHKTNIYT